MKSEKITFSLRRLEVITPIRPSRENQNHQQGENTAFADRFPKTALKVFHGNQDTKVSRCHHLSGHAVDHCNTDQNNIARSHKGNNRHHDRNVTLSHAGHNSENEGETSNDNRLRQRGIIKDADDFIQRADNRQQLNEVQNADDIENNFYPGFL